MGITHSFYSIYALSRSEYIMDIFKTDAVLLFTYIQLLFAA